MNIVFSFKEFRKRNAYTRIVKWNKYADNEPDKIKKFIFRWISFNGLYSVLYSMEHGQEKTENARDNEKMEYFFNNFILTNEILAAEIYSDTIKNIFKKEIKKDTRGIGDLLKNLDCEEKIELKARNMIKIAYKVRCRLFHGEKAPLLDVNEKVINAADQVITPILNYIIKTQ